MSSPKDESFSRDLSVSRRSAKLSLPKLGIAVQRARLFDVLDEQLQQHGIVWVHGPPGAGKTTLAGTFLMQSNYAVVWYRVDVGDGDLATFFSHLRDSAMNSNQAASLLPALYPEFLADVATFARNYFRALFALFNAATTLCLDNYQDAGEGVLDAILLVATAELPEHIRVVVLSRSAPSAVFSGLQLRHELGTIDWQTLRLTFDEARAIAAKLHTSDIEVVSALHTHCDGWAAGLVLLLEYTKRVGTPTKQVRIQAQKTVFHYFSRELFDTVPADAQRLLLCTALLPSFTVSQAATLSSQEEAEVALAWLQQRNFFIDYQDGEQRTYHYHALFRDFLLERGKAYFSPAERRELLLKSAHDFESNGQTEAAIELALEAQAWELAAGLICKLAPLLHTQGRRNTLEVIVEALPQSTLDATPWARYWLGLARIPFDPALGRAQLVLAFVSLRVNGDRTGQLMSCAAILNSFFMEWADQRGADRWVATLDELLNQDAAPLDAHVEAAIVSALPGLVLRNLQHPLAARLAERACEAYRHTQSNELRILMGTAAGSYFGAAGPVRRGQQILDEINATADFDKISPMLRLQWSMLEIYHAHIGFRINDYSARLATVERALQVTRASGIAMMNATIAGQCIYLTLKANDLPRAEHYLNEVLTSLNTARPGDTAQFLWHRAAVAFLQGDLRSAHTSVMECYKLSDSIGCTLGSIQSQILLVCILAELGEFAIAFSAAREMVVAAHALKSQPMIYSMQLARSYLLFKADAPDEGCAVLREALAYGQLTEQSSPTPWIPGQVMQQLCETALRHGMEVKQVYDTIACIGLRPRSVDIENWPWPIRIYTLGRFSVVLDGTQITFPSKAQKKPLNMLRMLIALGGRAVNINSLMLALWPEEGAGARAGFDVTLMRLRKLLRQPDAVTLTDGKLTLNPEICWVDSWAFERAVGCLDDTAAAREFAEAAAWYRGPFLGREHDIPCIVNTRDRLAAKFQRLVLNAGRQHERAGDWSAAALNYRLGLEQDNTREEFYRHLMACQLRLGEQAEAIKTYKRCRQMLSLNIQAKPSAETEALYKRLSAP